MLKIKEERNCFVCKTKEIALRFLEECKKQGINKWGGGMDIDEKENFYPYGENTFYSADYYNPFGLVNGGWWELHYGDKKQYDMNPIYSFFNYNGETDIEWILSEIKTKKRELKTLYKELKKAKRS